MAGMEALVRLQTRAATAEKLVSMLRLQIQESKEYLASRHLGTTHATSSLHQEPELDRLKAENETLRRDIESWKVKLTQAEVAHGKPVFYTGGGVAPPVTVNGDSAVSNASGEQNDVASSEGKKTKEAKVEKKKKEEPKKEGAGGDGPVDVGRLDLRVGHIRSAKKHPDADALYVEEVDVGEEKPRTVISGLVKFIPEAEMQDRMAVLLCNLKPSKMRGILSEAMVMCASTPDKVEILTPPAGSKPGDLVLVEGYARNPDGQLNPKKKVWETCAPDLAVNSDKEACYKGVRWTVNGQPVTSQTLINVPVK